MIAHTAWWQLLFGQSTLLCNRLSLDILQDGLSYIQSAPKHFSFSFGKSERSKIERDSSINSCIEIYYMK